MWCTQPGEAIIGLAPELAVDCTTEQTGDMLTLMYLYNNGVMCRKGEILATPGSTHGGCTKFPFPVSISSFRFISISCFSICPVLMVVALSKLCIHVGVRVNKPMHIPVISYPHTDAATTYFSIYFDMDIGHSKMGTQLKSA